MGCALTARFATKIRQLHAMVLEAPFASLKKAIAQKYQMFSPALHLLRYEMDTEKWVGQVETPTLVIYGDADQKILPSDCKKVFNASAAPVKEEIVIREGTHYLYQFGSGERIKTWLQKVI